MSWEATAWASKQTTGSPSAKALLLVIANHWNPESHCFASQKTLADESEQSIDSVQRQLVNLQRRGLITRECRTRLGGGRTSDLIILLMPGTTYNPNHRTIIAPPKRPKRERPASPHWDKGDAANQGNADGDRAPVDNRADTANCGSAVAAPPTARVRSTPTARVRYEPSIEPESEPKRAEHPIARAETVDRSQASNGKFGERPRDDLTDAELARWLGEDGWEILMALPADWLKRLRVLQRAGKLTERECDAARAEARLACSRTKRARAAALPGERGDTQPAAPVPRAAALWQWLIGWSAPYLKIPSTSRQVQNG